MASLLRSFRVPGQFFSARAETAEDDDDTFVCLCSK